MPVKQTIRQPGGKTKTVSLNKSQAIRRFCLECVCWQPIEVKKCTDPMCPLYAFRFGRDPSLNRSKKGHGEPFLRRESLISRNTHTDTEE